MGALKHFVVNEWYFSIPMFFMSFVGVTLVLWRFFLYMNARTKMEEFMPVFQDILAKEGIEPALDFCRGEPGLIPRKLFVAGLESSRQGISAMKRSMATAIRLEINPELHFLLAPILAIAKIATMVGLLGTVVSMIGTFNAIGEATKSGAGGAGGGVAAQAQSIGLALFATALGLLTAIPLVFTHVLFKDWISRFETKMEAAASRMLVMFQNIRPKQGVPRPKADPKAAKAGKAKKGKLELIPEDF